MEERKVPPFSITTSAKKVHIYISKGTAPCLEFQVCSVVMLKSSYADMWGTRSVLLTKWIDFPFEWALTHIKMLNNQHYNETHWKSNWTCISVYDTEQNTRMKMSNRFSNSTDPESKSRSSSRKGGKNTNDTSTIFPHGLLIWLESPQVKHWHISTFSH